MHFANPHFSIIFAVLAALVLFYLWTARRRRTLTERFAQKGLISHIAPSLSPARRATKGILTIAAFTLALVALLRPQWGFEWEETKKTGLDILIAVDVSKSMLSRDIKPNRLERSKLAVKDLIKRLKGDRIGLVAFAGTSFLQCPLTIDYNGFLLTLDDLTIDTIPVGGTSLASAIREAMNVFKGPEKKYKVLILITDGEELEGDALAAAKEAEKTGIKIYCVGVGSQEGEIIPIVEASGERAYLTDRGGKVVKSRLNEELLKQLAVSTGGSYVRATPADFGLTLLYDKSIERLEKKDIESKMMRRYEERFQIFLALAIILLFIEPLIAERRKVHL